MVGMAASSVRAKLDPGLSFPALRSRLIDDKIDDALRPALERRNDFGASRLRASFRADLNDTEPRKSGAKLLGGKRYGRARRAEIDPIRLPSLKMLSSAVLQGSKRDRGTRLVWQRHQEVDGKRRLAARLDVLPGFIAALVQRVVCGHVRHGAAGNMRDGRRRSGKRSGIFELDGDCVLARQARIEFAGSNVNGLEAWVFRRTNGYVPVDAHDD